MVLLSDVAPVSLLPQSGAAGAAAMASPGQLAATAEMAEKLDALMELTFAHLARRCLHLPSSCAATLQ